MMATRTLELVEEPHVDLALIPADGPSGFLSLIDRGRQALVDARDDFDRLRVRDTARAVAAAAAILDRRDVQVQASLLISDAEREIAKANPPAPVGRGKIMPPEHSFTIPPNTLSKIRTAHSRVSDEQYNRLKEEAIQEGEPLSRKALKSVAWKGGGQRAPSGDDEWYTPVDVIEAVRRCFGNIDLDPASCDVAQETVKADTYYTAEDDGLGKEWAGRVFMNPPYSRAGQKSAFISKLVDHYVSGSVSEAILLCSSDMSNKWADPIFDALRAICLCRRTMYFHKGDLTATKDTPQGHGQNLVYFGDRVGEFADAMGGFGCIMVPYQR